MQGHVSILQPPSRGLHSQEIYNKMIFMIVERVMKHILEFRETVTSMASLPGTPFLPASSYPDDS